MKINQVEELVGITKKNIRFYEEQGLIAPERNPENGYREYTLKDVEQLNKIKLLRRLSVPIEQIRLMQEGTLSFDQCMEQHILHLTHEQHELELTKEIVHRLSEEVDSISDIDSSKYFDEMKALEERGIQFMDVKNTDVRRKTISKAGALIAAGVIIIPMVMLFGFLIWASMEEPMPIAILLYFLGITALVIGGVLFAVYQRIKEINGGEVDEARKY